MSNNIDSRVILDTPGAEKLLGNGDMIFAQNARLERIQCGYIGPDYFRQKLGSNDYFRKRIQARTWWPLHFHRRRSESLRNTLVSSIRAELEAEAIDAVYVDSNQLILCKEYEYEVLNVLPCARD